MKHFALSDLSGCFLTKVMMAYYSLAANEWAVVVLLNFSLTHCVPGRSQIFFYVFNDILTVNNLEVETDSLNVSVDLYISYFKRLMESD